MTSVSVTLTSLCRHKCRRGLVHCDGVCRGVGPIGGKLLPWLASSLIGVMSSQGARGSMSARGSVPIAARGSVPGPVLQEDVLYVSQQ